MINFVEIKNHVLPSVSVQTLIQVVLQLRLCIFMLHNASLTAAIMHIEGHTFSVCGAGYLVSSSLLKFYF